MAGRVVATTIPIRNLLITAKVLRKNLVLTSPSISLKETYKHSKTIPVAQVTTVGSMQIVRALEAHRSNKGVVAVRCSLRS